jgi:hypothetical protein
MPFPSNTVEFGPDSWARNNFFSEPDLADVKCYDSADLLAQLLHSIPWNLGEGENKKVYFGLPLEVGIGNDIDVGNDINGSDARRNDAHRNDATSRSGLVPEENTNAKRNTNPNAKESSSTITIKCWPHHRWPVPLPPLLPFTVSSALEKIRKKAERSTGGNINNYI